MYSLRTLYAPTARSWGSSFRSALWLVITALVFISNLVLSFCSHIGWISCTLLSWRSGIPTVSAQGGELHFRINNSVLTVSIFGHLWFQIERIYCRQPIVIHIKHLALRRDNSLFNSVSALAIGVSSTLCGGEDADTCVFSLSKERLTAERLLATTGLVLSILLLEMHIVFGDHRWPDGKDT